MPSRDDHVGNELGRASALPALVRSSKEDSMVELLPRRIVEVMEMSSAGELASDSADLTLSENGRSTF